jgi:hypothetical protein
MKELFTAESAEDAEKNKMEGKARKPEIRIKAHVPGWEI